jgi:hypothetical protein
MAQVKEQAATEQRKEAAQLHSQMNFPAMVPIQMSGDGVASVDVGTIGGLEKSVAMAQRYFDLIEKIRRMAVSVTAQADWMDQDGNPYLDSWGAYKVANAFGVQVKDMVFDAREDFDDEQGRWLLYTVHGTASWNGREQPQIGSCSTRDKFFAKRKDKDGNSKFLPLSEINIGDVKKKAVTNLLSRAIKSQLGLDFSWDELEQLSGGKITKSGTPKKVTHENGKQGGSNQSDPKAIDARNEARKLILEMTGQDKDLYESVVAEASAYEYQGKPVAGKKSLTNVSDNAMVHVLKRVKDKYAAWQKSQGGAK